MSLCALVVLSPKFRAFIMNGPYYNIYLNCPLCGQLYSSISYPKYEDGMVICTCTAESVHNERSAREAVHNERSEENE